MKVFILVNQFGYFLSNCSFCYDFPTNDLKDIGYTPHLDSAKFFADIMLAKKYQNLLGLSLKEVLITIL